MFNESGVGVLLCSMVVVLVLYYVLWQWCWYLTKFYDCGVGALLCSMAVVFVSFVIKSTVHTHLSYGYVRFESFFMFLSVFRHFRYWRNVGKRRPHSDIHAGGPAETSPQGHRVTSSLDLR
uniref:Uncharacterized protein n=1 Tax=Cacopsylla melanoneura TaxID=428564 RepID=A0A8D9AZ22_9HEMI